MQVFRKCLDKESSAEALAIIKKSQFCFQYKN